MIRMAVAALGCGVLLFSACATTHGTSVGVTRTTSGEPNNECLSDDSVCTQNSDCCGLWCVNGECEPWSTP